MMKKLLALLSVLMVVCVLLAGCGGGAAASSAAPAASAAPGSETGAGASGLKVVALGEKLGVMPFYDDIYTGLQKASEDFGVESEYIEIVEIADFETQARFCAESGEYDLIILILSQIADVLKMIAADYPDQKFALLDAELDGVPNVHSLRAKDPEQHFLSGVISGMVTTGKFKDIFPMSNDANVLGYVGGSDAPISRSGAAGFMAGAKLVNQDVEILYTILNSYNDPAGGKESALTAIAKGADVVTGNCGSGIQGVLEACKEKGSYYIATSKADNDVDQSLCLSVKDAVAMMYIEVQMLAEGTWEPGVTAVGFKEGACGVSFEGLALDGKYPQEILDVVDKARQMVIDGDLVLPYDPDEVDAWAAENQLEW